MNINLEPVPLIESGNTSPDYSSAAMNAYPLPMDRGELLGHMGHELREPLCDVLSYVGALRQGLYGPLVGQQRHALNEVGLGLHRALNTVAHVVELGQLDGGERKAAVSSCLVADFCTSGIRQAQDVLEAKSLKLVTDLPMAKMSFLGDGSLLAQAIGESLHCAAESAAIGASLGLGVRAGENGKSLEIRVVGLDLSLDSFDWEEAITNNASTPAALEKLKRLRAVGLELLEKIVELHGGSLAISSNRFGAVSLEIQLPIQASASESISG